MHRFFVFVLLILQLDFTSICYADQSGPVDASAVELTDDDEILGYTQSELRQSFQSWLSLGFGNVNPWQFLNLSAAWSQGPNMIWVASLGGGNFEFTDTDSKGTSYYIDSKARTLSLGFRHYFTSFGSFYYEVGGQLNTWSGDIRPQGSDSEDDSVTSSLTSDYSHLGMTLGAKLGYSYFWDKWGIEFSLLQMSRSFLLDEAYTNNTAEARDNVKKQVEGASSWSGVNISILYRLGGESSRL
ncbi:hypothetical protein [Pseudobacteriovorax antillogorgiicola]|uniref:Outer membrane protein beta-barrel domain-containing protein n=1 Tax=Pseudobacteriovorax antillogorgiicola TaxID=1513793 RepID=A0A1Y6C1Q3_9BACT|nr:hypothetical protein [Pseudobacteriovorax antillogorgiicola]TCS50731.1 hypothetical protein EDD56_112114 [Pseudobacteriovorax antillogorgiicola]SMF40925.1 hypothetical protein SAMN06296036_112113 [Pseudobacteriovorax antillogorgiicola]